MVHLTALIISLTALLCFPAAADRFRVEGDILFFNMGYTGADDT